jgi:ribonuclease P protein component
VAGRAVGNAVARNRAKRRLREAVSLAPIRDGHDYVVIAGAGVDRVPFDDLVAWVRSAVGEQ